MNTLKKNSSAILSYLFVVVATIVLSFLMIAAAGSNIGSALSGFSRAVVGSS